MSEPTSFDNFWNQYDNKKSRDKCERKWYSLSAKDQTDCMESLPAYVASTPDRQYRKHPITYLNQKCWNDKLYAKGNETSLTVKWSKPKELSTYKPKKFNPEDGKSFIVGKIQKAYETGSRLNDVGEVFTNRLKPFLSYPESVINQIEIDVHEIATRKPRNRFEEKIEINVDLEVRNRILKYNMDIWREAGNKIYEKI